MELVYPNLNVQVAFEKNCGSVIGVYVCEKYCSKRHKTFISQELVQNILPLWANLLPLSPFLTISDDFKKLKGLEEGVSSLLLDLSVCLDGGMSRGYYKNMTGDLRLDEDLSGMAGTVVGQLKTDNDRKTIFQNALRAALLWNQNPLISQFFMAGERSKYNFGFPIVRGEHILGRGTEECGDVLVTHPSYRFPQNHLSISGHVIHRKEVVRRRQMRERSRRNLRAGVVYKRAAGLPKPVYWSEDVEAMVFPHLFPEGCGGFEWTNTKCIGWDEYIEKKLWKIRCLETAHCI